MKGQEILLEGTEVIVIVGNHPEGASHADDICRACAPFAKWVKRIDLPDLSPDQAQEDFFHTVEDIGEILKMIEDAPLWRDDASSS